MSEQEQFEAHYRGRLAPSCFCKKDGEYTKERTLIRWLAWQAAKAEAAARERELVAEVERLRELVKTAYWEGHEDGGGYCDMGMSLKTADSAYSDWNDSESRQALAPKPDEQEPAERLEQSDD